MIRPALVALVLLALALCARAQEAEAPAYTDAGADTCLRCHDEDSEFPVLAIFDTAHARAGDERTPFAKLQCETCHGPGDAHAGRVRRGQERPQLLNFGEHANAPAHEQNAVCLGCHASDAEPGWHGGMHERGDVACADCHRIHAAHDAVRSTAEQPAVCYRCHRKERADAYKASSHPLRYGQMACSDCHAPHGSLTEASLVADTVNDTCYQCHAEKRGPMLWEHAPVSEDCTLCHRPHGSNHPALLTRRMPFLCQQCHSQAGHPSLPGTGSGLPGQAPSALLLMRSCANCHSQVHGSNHPSGATLSR